MERINRLETWARLGYAARGIVYVLLGYIALSTGKALSTGETVEAVEQLPGGAPLLVVLAFGLFGYGAFKIYSSLLDLDNEGDDVKGRVKRVARAVGGIAYLILAFIATKQLFGSDKGSAEAGQATGSGGMRQDAAQQVSDNAGGDMLIVLVGLIILAVAAAQLIIAYKAKFSNEMPGAPPVVKPAGQIGYAARAIVVAITGYFTVKAGLDGERLRNFGDALALIRDDYPTAFQLIAVGLILFGLVSLMMARYRRIADDNVIARLKSKVPSAAR